MRLSDVLSKPPDAKFVPVDGFINRNLPVGKQRQIDIGRICATYYCEICGDTRTFKSTDKLFCVGVSPKRISIDCVMECVGECDSSVAVWFLVESYGDIVGLAPEARILKRREKLSEQVRLVGKHYADYAEMLDKSERAYMDGLGAGAMVYLRKIFEKIILQTASVVGINANRQNGKRKPFKELLEEVDKQCSIIPREFSENGYKLFGELSDVVHGECDEQLGLRKFEPLHRLVVGIIENVKNNKEIMSAIGSLGWNDNGGVS
jgi:hypothetical protein